MAGRAVLPRIPSVRRPGLAFCALSTRQMPSVIRGILRWGFIELSVFYFYIYRCNCLHALPVIVHTFIPPHSPHHSPHHRSHQDPTPESSPW
eukprot:6535710-Prymnesium_polylepis.1